MASINSPIPYQWRLGWRGVSGRPLVNPLLKAIIEENVLEMERLASLGASLKASDPTTLRRVLFHVVHNYTVMAWLVKHGISIRESNGLSGKNHYDDKKCISPTGHFWGLTARAYYLKAYDVMDLLASHGFDEFVCYEPRWDKKWEADAHILQTGDPIGLKILLENGYIFDDVPFYQKYYEMYVLNRPQVKRKTIGLDLPARQDISTPRYEKEPLIWGRRETKGRNARRHEDYEDRIRAHKEYLQSHRSSSLDTYIETL